jgi:hypothetical protein
VMPVAKADARQVVKGRASEGERAAMVALLEQARAHAATVQTHSQWVDNLVEGAHSEANDREWCEVLCIRQVSAPAWRPLVDAAG